MNSGPVEKGGDKAILSSQEQGVVNSTGNTFSSLRGVKHRKNHTIKTRLKTLIQERGMSEPDFFHSIGLTRQHWYYISWDIWPTSIELKLKIAQALGTDSCLIWQEDSE